MSEQIRRIGGFRCRIVGQCWAVQQSSIECTVSNVRLAPKCGGKNTNFRRLHLYAGAVVGNASSHERQVVVTTSERHCMVSTERKENVMSGVYAVEDNGRVKAIPRLEFDGVVGSIFGLTSDFP